MKGLRWFGVFLVLIVTAVGATAESYDSGLGIRAGIGTDITFGGVAFGVGVNYLFLENLEAGVVLYYGSFKETTEETVNTYDETTTITAFAALLNYLYNYSFGENRFFVLAGIGVGYVGVDWEERSDTDSSLGTPLAGGGSKQEVSGGLGGLLTNLGLGYAFDFGLDLRFEVPILFPFGDVGEARTIIPLFTLTGGYRFKV
jgi:hypothetical protein